jgi:hypothetical protein
MVDFAEVIADLPGLKELSPAAREGLTQQVMAQICGAHRWPFLLKVQETKTWAANDSVQKIPGVSRIWNIMFPGSGGTYYRLEELSDIEFQRAIENSPNETQTYWWRDAGLDGDDLQIELHGVPTTATVLKIDYTMLPSMDTIDDMPFRFQGLVRDGLMATFGNYGAKEIFRQNLQEAIAREMDLQGKRDRMGIDMVQSSRLRNRNNPS